MFELKGKDRGSGTDKDDLFELEKEVEGSGDGGQAGSRWSDSRNREMVLPGLRGQ